MKKTLLITVLMASSMMVKNAAAACPEGISYCGTNCGTNCSWSIDTNGKLTVYATDSTQSAGIGNYSETYTGSSDTHGGRQYLTTAPWKSYNVTSIEVVGDKKDAQGNITSHGISNIGKAAFDGKTGVTSLVLPDSLNSVEWASFYQMTSLSGEVKIPEGITTIPKCGFSRLYNVTSFVIPDTVTSIEEDGFYYAESVQSLVIPNSVTSIGKTAFSNMNSLTSLVIPDSVTSIGAGAFGTWTTGVGSSVSNHITDLTISAENLQRFLSADGGFKLDGDLNITCTTGDCASVLAAWDAAKGTNYASRTTFHTPSSANSGSGGSGSGSGSIDPQTNVQNSSVFGPHDHKRIYTVEEASAVAGKKNSIMIRYK